MSDLEHLLRSLGLEQYVEVFDREEVDIKAARLLGDGDFAELGIPLGPRRKIQTALKGEQAPEAAAAARPTAERRQLTVLFCDLVGSTALSGKLDPEELRSLMGSYQSMCRGVVEKYAGQVAQYLGDGVMAYFGWPVAHEDDAERALRAGLELVGAVKRVSGSPEALRVRIGVATGAVVVGEGRGEGEDPKLAVGETPNVASRLQALAGEDELVVGSTTRRLAGGVFGYEDLGSHVLKGIVEPVQAWRVRGLEQTEGRFEASRGAEQRLSAFVGREQEVGLLASKWAQACGGERQVVLLEGEPGIGKSRITQWLLEHIGAGRHYRLRYQCSPYHAQSAFHPIIEQIERAARIGAEDGFEQKLDKLEALLNAPSTQSSRTLALFAALLGIGGGEARYGALNVTPQKQKELTLQALGSHVAGLSADAPVLLLLEDAHWIDPSTLESLSLTVEAIRSERVLVLITYRPEFKAPWTGQSHVSHVILNRLSARQTRALAEHVAGGHALPEEIVEQITTKTDGIPLFVEELTKAVLEAGLLELDAGANAYRLKGPLSPIAIPATLRDSLTARLDRLSPTKEVAQIGACIGREFGYGLLEKVANLPEAQLNEALNRLTESELVFQKGSPPEASYTFKHALIQDAAYDGLLKSRRAQIHARIAQVLEASYTEVATAHPEVVARHYGDAGAVANAVTYWLMAGRVALARMALEESLSHLSSGLTRVSDIDDEARRQSLALELYATLGTVHMARNGWAHSAVEESYRKALSVMTPQASPDVVVVVIWGRWVTTLTQGRIEESLTWARRLLDEAQERADLDVAVMGLNAEQVSRFWLGDFERSRDNGNKVLSGYDFDRYRRLATLTNHNPRTGSGLYLAQATWILGFPDAALAEYENTVVHARRHSNPFDLCFAIVIGGYVLSYRGDIGGLDAAVREALTISTEQSLPFIRYSAAPGLSAAGRLEKGLYDEVIAVLPDLVSMCTAGGLYCMMPFWRGVIAQALTGAGRPAEALNYLDVAFGQIQTAAWNERAHLAELLRIKGEALKAMGEHDGAETAFLESLQVARQQRARSWELRTSLSLSRFLKVQARNQEAVEVLRPIYDWFTEGRDTKDHIEARQLLQELGG